MIQKSIENGIVKNELLLNLKRKYTKSIEDWFCPKINRKIDFFQSRMLWEGLLGPIQNLHFTSVLGVRHVRSDERVARPREKFAFKYHSFERPTRPKWRKGRSATWKICVLPQFWASDTSEVTKGSIGDVKNLRFTTVLSVRHARSHERVVKSTGAIPAPQTEKELILRLFQKILISFD